MAQANVTMRDMLEAGVHFGHQKRFWNPKMKQYIFGERHKIHIINLEKTLPAYLDAVNFLSKLASKRGKILFVGTKKAAQEVIAEEATRAGMPYVNHRWLGGMLTNYKTVRQSVKRLRDFEKMRDEGVFDQLVKKEALQKEREITKLERSFGGIKNMAGLPDALFIIDSCQEAIAIEEAKRLGIPVVAIVDTNGNPDDVDYLIPGNDDAIRAIRFYLKGIVDAILHSKEVSRAESHKEEASEDEPAVERKVAKKTTKKAHAEEEPKVAHKAHEEKAEEKPAKKAADKKVTVTKAKASSSKKAEEKTEAKPAKSTKAKAASTAKKPAAKKTTAKK
ncbi:MAG: ribosomal protein [Gammaproteobacteria bacterium]|jgi:small subunit ribosomal protein S2|nr:ribosomal protein [Gammaproteobacteria bacterium]